MKLAVVGDSAGARGVVRHGTKTGFQMHDATHAGLDMMHAAVVKAVKGADAVLCVLHKDLELLDESSHKAVKSLVDVMQQHGVKRLVLFSFMTGRVHQRKHNKKLSLTARIKGFLRREADDALNVLRVSGLDWTVVASGHKNVPPKDLAKHMFSQLTSTANLQQVFVVPNENEQV